MLVAASTKLISGPQMPGFLVSYDHTGQVVLVNQRIVRLGQMESTLFLILLQGWEQPHPSSTDLFRYWVPQEVLLFELGANRGQLRTLVYRLRTKLLGMG